MNSKTYLPTGFGPHKRKVLERLKAPSVPLTALLPSGLVVVASPFFLVRGQATSFLQPHQCFGTYPLSMENPAEGALCSLLPQVNPLSFGPRWSLRRLRVVKVELHSRSGDGGVGGDMTAVG